MSTAIELLTAVDLLRKPRDGYFMLANPDTVRAPDVAFVTKARIEEVGGFEGFWIDAADGTGALRSAPAGSDRASARSMSGK